MPYMRFEIDFYPVVTHAKMIGYSILHINKLAIGLAGDVFSGYDLSHCVGFRIEQEFNIMASKAPIRVFHAYVF